MKRIIPDNPIQEWLIQTHINNPLVYIDNWSLIHFSSGFIIGAIFSKYFNGHRILFYIYVLLLLIAYEWLEIFVGNYFFYPENGLDIIWDVIIGMLGCITYRYYIHTQKNG